MKPLRSMAMTLAGLCAFLCILSGIAYTQVTSTSQMLNGFLQFADTSSKGVPASAYPDYAKAITGYLTGQQSDLTVTAADGTQRPGFSEKELAHMADVRGLVRGLSLLRYAAGGLALLILALYWFHRQHDADREKLLADVLKGAARSAYLLLGIVLALGIWGAVNFTGLFVTFHKVFFRNDLWLLNPRQHLLIMLMPTRFFVWYAGQIALACWPVLAMMAAVIIAAIKLGREQHE